MAFRNTNLENGSTIALVSFPGSGNTWLRYLLQQATGIITGSEYNGNGDFKKDMELFQHSFPGNFIKNGIIENLVKEG